MSSVFEAGISLACIVIIHNWFKETIMGTVCSLWMTAIYMQKITQIAIYKTQEQQCSDDLFEKTLMIESYVLSGCYLVLAVICWFFFYHHPSHIGVQINSQLSNANSYTFNIDNSNTPIGLWNRTTSQRLDSDDG